MKKQKKEQDMNEHIAEKFIDLVAKLYDLSDKAIEAMRVNGAEIDGALGGYYWEDIKDAVNTYFVRKNDKTRPTLAKILALLETNDRVKKRVPEPDENKYHLPRTQLWSIRDTFDAVIRTMVQCKILEPENPIDAPVAPGYSLVDATGTPMINPKQFLRWQVADAKAVRPDVFAPYKSTSFWEDLAIAVQARLITLRVRDWHETFYQLPATIKAVIRDRRPGATGVVNEMITAWPGYATAGVMEVR